MKKFEFKLETLLNIKIQKEDLIRIKLAAEIKKLDYENKKLDLLLYEKQKQVENYIELLNCGIAVSKIKEYNGYISQLAKKIEEQKLNINIVEKNVDKIRSELVDISRERKIIEKFKAKKLMAFRAEVLKEEQKAVDEIISYRYNPGLVG